MILEEFKPEHLDEIDLQDEQRSWYEYEQRLEYARGLTRGLGYTVRVAGQIIVCGGVLPVDQSTGQLWCFMSKYARTHLITVHRVALRFMQISGLPTLYATSEADFANGCRWLLMLGFKQSAVLHKYGPDGRDHILYTKVL
jgi:hypothetical protein